MYIGTLKFVWEVKNQPVIVWIRYYSIDYTGNVYIEYMKKKH